MKITKKQLEKLVKESVNEELMSEAGPKMTRQHFQLIADVLKNNNAPGPLVQAFTYALERTNPGFDASRFLQAATSGGDAGERPEIKSDIGRQTKGAPWE